jgi:hypothetical protein
MPIGGIKMVETMMDDDREISGYSNDAAQQSIFVGQRGITKIEVYREHGERDYVPWLAIWKDGYLYMRTSAVGKEIVYKEPDQTCKTTDDS